MAEVDVSSYRQPPLPSALDTVGKLGALQQQKIGIDQSQLKLMNDQFQIMNNELATLANDPSKTKEEAAKRMQTVAQTLKLPPQVVDHMMGELRAAPDVPTFAKTAITRGMSTMEKVNTLYGVPGVVNDQQRLTPIATSPFTGMRQTGPGVQIQAPPDQPQVTSSGTRYLGPQNQQQAPGPVLPVAPMAPQAGPMRAPVAPSARVWGDKEAENAGIYDAPKPRGGMMSQPPMFEEGKKMLAEDQDIATGKLTAIKPALQVLPLLKDLRSGPTTEPYTRAIAILKANGIIPTGTAENDPTAIRQMVNKKLADYVRSNPVGQRSDAAQALSESASPSAKEQINPALIKLTKDAIILDRVQAARAGAFEGNDYSKYGNHRSTFPARVDEKAFGLDLMEPKDRKKLLDDMRKKKDTFEGKKFWKTLEIVDKQGLINTAE